MLDDYTKKSIETDLKFILMFNDVKNKTGVPITILAKTLMACLDKAIDDFKEATGGITNDDTEIQ